MLLFEFLHTQGPTPFIMLTENADEKVVADIIQYGAYDCVERSQLTGANLLRNHPVRAQFTLDAAGKRRNNPCASFLVRQNTLLTRYLLQTAKTSLNI
jgi:hypothetical protein